MANHTGQVIDQFANSERLGATNWDWVDTWLLISFVTPSIGGNLEMAPTLGFQGYLLIRCEFPNARVVAFLSDVAAQKIGPLYHAEVIAK